MRMRSRERGWLRTAGGRADVAGDGVDRSLTHHGPGYGKPFNSEKIHRLLRLDATLTDPSRAEHRADTA